ncbi:uncharacterized protein LOC133785002 [Humulus lupulus]|uniref:uncharacterized protein LOC133785002 n=1 Tax=Humulus lupulus TaxID=3486 RepID=UPI002B40EA5B|nr:uncharacterized protein LOC133785002 [Humulus lupulus]
MVKTRGASSKRTPAFQSKKVPSPSPPPSMSMVPPSAPAPVASVGKTPKSKARRKVFSLSTEHPMVFPDITADIVNVAPPSGVVVPSQAKNLSPFPIELSLTAREKSKSVSSSSKATVAGLLKLPMKPSQSKKNSVAPKRKLGLDSSSSPLTVDKKILKAHPPSPSSSKSEPKEAKFESEDTHDTTLSNESVLDNAKSEAEFDELEQEDVVPTEQETKSDTESVATPLSSKGKGKRLISDSTPSPRLSSVNFKPHSSTFCYSDNARDMVLYAQRKFLIERNYVLSDHRPYGVLTMLQDRKWTGSLVKFTSFVDRIVKEFYANLTNEIIDPKSPLYCKVYVRGHWFSFSLQDIAEALHLPLDVEDDDDLASLDKDAVITELVGQKMVWPSNTIISVTNLTYTYDVLDKFSTTNWKPTLHTSTISFDMASFLYKVGTGIASAPTTKATDAPSTKKAKPQSLKFTSDDIPLESSSVPTDSGPVATELAVVRASVDSLAARVMTIEGLQRSVLDDVQTLSKDPAV